MKQIMIALMIGLFAQVSVADDAIDCAAMKTDIMERMKDADVCYEDTDCYWGSIECPWTMMTCSQIPLSTTAETGDDTVRKAMKDYEAKCADSVTAECAFYDERMKTMDCSKQIRTRLMCVSGRCLDINRIMIKSKGTGEDIYGSKNFLGSKEMFEKTDPNSFNKGDVELDVNVNEILGRENK